MTGLQGQLDQFRAGWQERVGPEIVELVARNNAALQHQLSERAPKPGMRLPDAMLLDRFGKPTRILDLVRNRPAIISFYRGGWCPYCSMELRAYQALLDRIRLAGGDLIAISPERPVNAHSTAEKNELAFPVLSDAGGELSQALGLRFELSEEIVALYRKFGLDLPAHNGDGTWALPIPATLVLDRHGTIVLTHAEADYRTRLEPGEALRVLESLGRG